MNTYKDTPYTHFYAQFACLHKQFQQYLQTVAAANTDDLTVALLLIRLMVLYFLQKQGLLDDDSHYLTHRFKLLRASPGSFYTFFCYVYKQIFSNETIPAPQFQSLAGRLPHLPGTIELSPDNSMIAIPDHLFTMTLACFDQFSWTLEETGPSGAVNSVYPGLISLLFEKYLHRKSTGSYYTSPDVTSYISTNTIIPCLLSIIQDHYPQLLAPGGPVIHCLHRDPDRYIFQALRCTDRLPTETDREYQERQKHYHILKDQLCGSDPIDLAEMITSNLRLAALAHDLIACSQDPHFLQVCYEALTRISILDPTCGSGSFLRTALAILETLYTACLDRMQFLCAGKEKMRSMPGVDRLQCFIQHTTTFPTLRSFIISSILRHNLYGVDLVPEAVEVCQLRLLLILLSTMPRHIDLSCINDTPIHIFTGNALVGFTSSHAVPAPAHIDQQCNAAWLDRAYARFCSITEERYEHIQQYEQALQHWHDHHQPLHWHLAFPAVMQSGGFDVIIGNPPYIEYSTIKSVYQIAEYEAESCGNLYAAVTRRALALSREQSSFVGMIVPLSICGSERFARLRAKLRACSTNLWLANFEIFPSRLFDHAYQRLSILLAMRATASNKALYVTCSQRWYAAERPYLLPLLRYTRVHQQQTQFPKLASSLHEDILQKIVDRARGQAIAHVLLQQPTPHFVFYQEATNYWIKATCHIPFYKKNGITQTPAHSRMLYVSEQDIAFTIMALLNSSLFYAWFVTYSDGFHLSHTLVKNFPVHPELYQLPQLHHLGRLLEDDVRSHAQRSTRNTHAGRDRNRTRHLIELEAYHMSYSKPLIDKIDTVLAAYYQFTTEELDFILHYDSKYRSHS